LYRGLGGLCRSYREVAESHGGKQTLLCHSLPGINTLRICCLINLSKASTIPSIHIPHNIISHSLLRHAYTWHLLQVSTYPCIKKKDWQLNSCRSTKDRLSFTKRLSCQGSRPDNRKVTRCSAHSNIANSLTIESKETQTCASSINTDFNVVTGNGATSDSIATENTELVKRVG